MIEKFVKDGASTVVYLFNGNQVLYSYDIAVAVKISTGQYRVDKRYSSTTTKHVNAWCDSNAIVASPELFDSLVNSAFQL